jgi:predicted kinase
MQELIIFVGLQGAGKSTLYQERFAATHMLVSKDQLHNTRNKQRQQMQLLMEYLEAGRSVVIDNTNPTEADRAPLIAEGKRIGAQVIGYHFAIPLGICLARNRQREGSARVPDIALYATAKRLVPPQETEGFDAIYSVTLDTTGQRIILPENT